jgi:uncharacterized Tic20 family protein
MPGPKPDTGVKYWLLYLILWAPVPLLNWVALVIVEFSLRESARRTGGPAEANSRNALNWVLTWGLVNVLAAALHFGLLFALTGDGGSIGSEDPLFWVPVTTASLLGLAVIGGGIATLVFMIVGAVKAANGRVFHPRIAIPFI